MRGAGTEQKSSDAWSRDRTEVFSALLRKGEEDGLIAGIKICSSAPSISHLLFADDSLILIRANAGDCSHLQKILQIYEECSGQVINKAKSAILFSKNTQSARRKQVCDLLQITKETANEKYLGLPVHVGKSKTNTFAYIKDRIWKRMQGWNEKFLSWAGKEILIKAVAQAIPTFAMGCFDLSKTLCDQIGAMICRFWWNHQEGKHKIHWLSKDQMMKPKDEGGLGFRDIHCFNMAMLAKQNWRLLQNPDSLCARVLKAKYFATSSVLDAKPKHGMSYSWRSILAGLKVVKQGMIWRVGDGMGLNMWSEPWIPRDTCRKPITLRRHNILTEIAELIDPYTGQWDEALVRDVFWEVDAELILALPVHQGRQNSVAWHFDRHGRFSVKSAYKVAREDFLRTHSPAGQQGGSTTRSNTLWRRIWSLSCPNKIKHFMWRFALNSHPLRGNLRRRGMKIQDRCPVCDHSGEDGGHLFFKCKMAKQVWCLLGLETERKALASMHSAVEALEFILNSTETQMMILITALWYIWAERNAIREEGRRRPPQILARSVEMYVQEMKQNGSVPPQRGNQNQAAWRWVRPPTDVLKLNYDGSFLPESRAGGWGALIRDHDGDVVMSGRGRINHLMNPMHAELIACLQGIQMAVNCGISKLIVETDAQEVVKAISSDAYDDSQVGFLVDEIKLLLATNFSQIECVFPRRACNRAAHELAALGVACVEGEGEFTISLPQTVFVIVADESSVE